MSQSIATSDVGEVEADEMPELDSLILRDLVCVLWLLLLLSPASSASWSSRRSRNLCSRINCTFCDRCFLSRSSRLRMKHLALFRRPSVVWRLESEPRGTNSFSRSKQPLRWALLWVTCPVSKGAAFLGNTFSLLQHELLILLPVLLPVLQQ